MMVYFCGLVLKHRRMVLEGLGILVLGVDYSVVGYNILGVGRKKYVQQFWDCWDIDRMVLRVGRLHLKHLPFSS